MLVSRVFSTAEISFKFTYKTDKSFELDNKYSVLILNRIISVISVLDKIKKPNSVFYNLLK